MSRPSLSNKNTRTVSVSSGVQCRASEPAALCELLPGEHKKTEAVGNFPYRVPHSQFFDRIGKKREIMKTVYTRGLCHRLLCCFFLLMAFGAQAGWQGFPPLQIRFGEHEFIAACRQGNCPAVQFYLEQEGFDPNKKRRSGFASRSVTGLFCAAAWGQTDAVRILVTARANIEQSCLDGATPLFIASYKGHTEAVRSLITAGAKIDCSCIDGATPLFIASQNGHAQVVRILLEAGANPAISWSVLYPLNFSIFRRAPLTQAKIHGRHTWLNSQKRRRYNEIISMLGQAVVVY